jgi:phosphoenolpyruvate carboxylase
MLFAVLQPKCQLKDLRNRFPCIDPLQNLQVELVRRYRSGMYDNGAQMGIHIVNHHENCSTFPQQNQ